MSARRCCCHSSPADSARWTASRQGAIRRALLRRALGGADMDDLRLSDISHDGRFLTLNDGTRWMVADLDVERSARWEPRERVAVSDRTGDASRIVNNLDRWDEPVRAWAWGGQE